MHDQDELEFYRGEDGDVRWRYRAAGNHEPLANGGEGYADLRQAMESAYRVVGIDESERHHLLASATNAVAAVRGDGSSVLVVFSGV